MKKLRYHTTVRGLLLISLALAPACGSDGEPNEATGSEGPQPAPKESDAGPATGPSKQDENASTGSGATAMRCTPERKPLWMHADTDGFEVSRGELFFVDGTKIDSAIDSATYGPGAEIRKVQKDGTSTVVYAVADVKQQRIAQRLWVEEEDIYFLMLDRSLPAPLNQGKQLYRIARTGGAPVRISSAERGYDGVGITYLDSDADALYAHSEDQNAFIRISKTTGLSAIIHKGTRQQVSPQLFDDKIWFIPYQTSDIHWVPKRGEAATATVFAKAACGVSLIPRVSVSEAGTLCGGERHALDGSELPPVSSPPGLSPTPLRGGAQFFWHDGAIHELNPATLEYKRIGCGAPLDLALIRADETTVFWLEGRYGDPSKKIVSAPRAVW